MKKVTIKQKIILIQLQSNSLQLMTF